MTPLSQATVLGDVLRGHSQLRPAKVAVETLDGRSVTFAQLNSRVNSLVASVSAVGISKGLAKRFAETIVANHRMCMHRDAPRCEIIFRKMREPRAAKCPQ